MKVRLVKGANLAMERVDAELHGWPVTTYGSKAEVDGSYKRLLDRALDPNWGDGLRVGLASHNTFELAWGIVRATRFGTLDRVDIEMLEGMAPGQSEAVRARVGGMTLYAPVVRRDTFDAAIAYLVRRLDENTAPGNFLRHQVDLVPGSPAFVEQRDRFLAAVAARPSTTSGMSGVGDVDAGCNRRSIHVRLAARVQSVSGSLVNGSASENDRDSAARSCCRFGVVSIDGRAATAARNRSRCSTNAGEPGTRSTWWRRKLPGAVFSSSRRTR